MCVCECVSVGGWIGRRADAGAARRACVRGLGCVWGLMAWARSCSPLACHAALCRPWLVAGPTHWCCPLDTTCCRGPSALKTTATCVLAGPRISSCPRCMRRRAPARAPSILARPPTHPGVHSPPPCTRTPMQYEDTELRPWDAKRVLRETYYIHFSDWPVNKPWSAGSARGGWGLGRRRGGGARGPANPCAPAPGAV